MIAEEQKELANYIKSVHLSLRCKSRQIGAELAWKEHLENEETLRNYAASMKNLAENYWSLNNRNGDGKCLCRIEWMLNVATKYFEFELMKEVSKEKKKLENFVSRSLVSGEEIHRFQDRVLENFKTPYRLLDVGSCYDPFAAHDIFLTFPVDLYPANQSVKKCDFTQLHVRDYSENDLSWFRDNMDTLPRNYFHIVVFSLFLEYLPSPEQRYRSCELAYETLKENGILLIATPDSKHESANARFMKAWKIALAHIGFHRIRLDKLRYLYCMAFRKAVSSKYPSALYSVRDLNNDKSIPIPQDYVVYGTERDNYEPCEINEEENIEAFGQLPFSDVAAF